MTENQNLADIARKKRYLHLVEKLQGGKALSKQEIEELERFEAEPQGPEIVKTMEEVAKAMGVSCRSVRYWKKDGMPIAKGGFYDLKEIRAWHSANKGDGKGDKSEGRAYWDEKIKKSKATLLDMEVKKAKNELLPRDEVEKDMIEKIITIKRSFLALPTRMAPVLAMKEPREIEVELYNALREIIDEFAGVKQRPESVDASAEAGMEMPGQNNGEPVGGSIQVS